MNGPLDNPISSCMSCHQTAQKPNAAPLTPGTSDTWDTAKCWFRDISPTEAFGAQPTATSCGAGTGLHSLDFSLRLQVGWRNWNDAHPVAPAPPQVTPPSSQIAPPQAV